MIKPSSPFDAEFDSARPLLLLRGLFAILGADCWVDMVPHGGRYGVDGFNVAHVAWLDRLLPLPTAGLYVALLVACGGMSVFCACWPQARSLRVAVLLSYTLSWAISMHDSYQHHYLLSWLLLGAALIDAPAARAPSDAQMAKTPATRPEEGFVTLLFTCAIVYGFTALAKLGEEWRDGSVLRVLAEREGLRAATHHLGAWEPLFWCLLANSVTLLEIVVALGYLACLAGDRAEPSAARALLVWAAFFSACAFHVGAELSGIFEIGWFSIYMLWMAWVCLLPAPVLRGSVQLLVRSTGSVRRRSARVSVGCVWLAFVLSASGAWAMAAHSHVPGAVRGLGIFWVVSAVTTFATGARAARTTCAPCLAAVAANISFCACFGLFPVAFDYHRRLAGELARLGRDEASLAAYREAERVAPRGESRQGKIRALEQALRAGQRAPR